MSNSNSKNFGDILTKLRTQVSENSESIKQILETNKKLLDTVSQLEDSIATLVELKVNESYASLISRIETLEKQKRYEYNNTILSRLVIHNSDWKNTQEAVFSVGQAYPEILEHRFSYRALSEKKFLIDFPNKIQRQIFTRKNLAQVPEMYFSDYIPKNLSYPEY